MGRILNSESKEKLRQQDRTWGWKVGFRSALFVIDIIAIAFIAGAAGAIANYTLPDLLNGDGGYGYSNNVGGDYLVIYWVSLIPLILSIIWAAVQIPIILFRQAIPHPGFSVAFDLILTIAYLILNGVFYAVSVYSINGDYGGFSYGYGSSSSYPGCDSGYYNGNGYNYRNCQNGEEAIASDDSYTYYYVNGTTALRSPLDSNYLCPAFDTCAQQDNYVSATASAEAFGHRVSIVLLVAGVFYSIGALIHIILFIWACVDTHAYNRAAIYDGRARVIADQMIRDMRNRGEIMSPGGTAYPAGGAYPQMQQQQQAQQPLLFPQDTAYRGAAASPSADAVAQGVRENPGDIEGQYANGPRLGMPRGLQQSGGFYEPVKTSADDEIRHVDEAPAGSSASGAHGAHAS